MRQFTKKVYLYLMDRVFPEKHQRRWVRVASGPTRSGSNPKII